jgi:hypothetical protein
MNKLAFRNSDAIIEASKSLPEDLNEAVKNSDKRTLEYCEPDACVKTYSDFYDTILEENSVLAD